MGRAETGRDSLWPVRRVEFHQESKIKNTPPPQFAKDSVQHQHQYSYMQPTSPPLQLTHSLAETKVLRLLPANVFFYKGGGGGGGGGGRGRKISIVRALVPIGNLQWGGMKSGGGKQKVER
jgi:hypothetical protein